MKRLQAETAAISVKGRVPPRGECLRYIGRWRNAAAIGLIQRNLQPGPLRTDCAVEAAALRAGGHEPPPEKRRSKPKMTEN
jgi:hypothetical protein